MKVLNDKERAEIRKRYPNIYFPDPSLEPIWYGRRPEKQVEGKFAIVDQNKENVFGICSEYYRIIPYEDIVSLPETVFDNIKGKHGNATVTLNTLNNGGKLKILARLLDVPFEIKKGDIVNPTISIRTSYDLGWKMTCEFGAFRLVCSNGMKVGKVFGKYAKRHLISIEPEKITETILNGMELYNQQTDAWKKWAKTKVPEVAYNTIWQALPFSENEKAKVEKLAETGTQKTLEDKKWRDQISLWDFHSVISQYVTHEVNSDIRRVDLEETVAKVFDNAYANMAA